MTKEIMLEIINKRLFFELALIIIVYTTASLINFKLGFQILGIKVGLKRLIPAILIMTLYTLYAKYFLPVSISGVLMVLLVIFLLTVTGRVNVIKASWTALLTIISNAIGSIIFIDPLCSFDQNIAFFFLKTPYGNITGSLIEVLIPALALFILPKINISLIPPFKKRIANIDIIGVITYGAMFYTVYCASLRLWASFNGNPRNIIANLICEWITVFVIISGHYSIVTNLKKRYDIQIHQLIKENQKLTDLNSQLKAKNIEPEEVIEVMESIVKRLQTNIKQIKSNNLPENGHPIPPSLNPREKSVLELIVQGKSNKEIAASLYLSEGGVKNIITKLFDKLGVGDRIQLVVYAIENHLVNRN